MIFFYKEVYLLNEINVVDYLNHFKFLKYENLKTKVKWVILRCLNMKILNYW